MKLIGIVDLVRHARDQPAERRHLLGLHQLRLGRLELAVGVLELRRPLADALLEARVQRDQRLVRRRVLERDRRLVRERAQERRVAGGVEEPRALRPDRQRTDELPAVLQRHGDVRAEDAQRRAHCVARGRVPVCFGRVEGGRQAPLAQHREQRRGHGLTAATDLQRTPLAPTDEHPRAGVRHGAQHGVADQRGDVVARQRRRQVGPHLGQHARAVVVGAEEHPVDERLEAGPQRIEDHQHRERERDRERRRVGDVAGAEHEVEDDHRRHVRRRRPRR